MVTPYWEDREAGLTIYLGDNRLILPELQEGSIDLTVTSPPYDHLRTRYAAVSLEDLADMGRQVFRLTTDGGIAVLVMQDGTVNRAKTLTTFRTVIAWADAGFKLFECIIWAKDGRPGAWWNRRFRVDHEYMPTFLKGAEPRHFDKEPLKVPCRTAGSTMHGVVYRNDGRTLAPSGTVTGSLKCRGTVWSCPPSASDADKSKLAHPATFPDRLAMDHILCWTVPGDLVFDPYLGSGTSLVAAKMLGRRGAGVEIAEEYAALAVRRIERTTRRMEQLNFTAPG